MARRVPTESWSAVAVHRRWGCFLSALILALLAAAIFLLLIGIVRPRVAAHPLYLIGSDVDGLVVIELNRSSARVGRLLQTLVRPISYDVQSRPEDVAQQTGRLLDVMTFRRAIGLLRYDPLANHEQWALVIPLKRMGDLLKVVIEQLAAREGAAKVQIERAGGVLLFWGKPEMPCFGIDRHAFLAASDRQWLGEVLSRLRSPLPKTPQARQLYYGLPEGGKHCIARACLLVSSERWTHWGGRPSPTYPFAPHVRRVHSFLAECGLEPAQIRSLTLATAIQPRGQLHLDLRVACVNTSASLELARSMRANWSAVAKRLEGTDVAELTQPTTTTTGIAFGWTTHRIEQMLGLAPADATTPPPR